MSQLTDTMRAIPTSYVILGLAALVMLGFSITLARLFSVGREREDIFKWRQSFIMWANDGFEDNQLYMKLMSESPRIQKALGEWGIMATFSPPFARLMYHNWPIILNGLPIIRQYSSDYILSRNQLGQYFGLVDDALLRAIGALDDNLQQFRRTLLNPIALLREGIVRVITVPVYMLAEFGLLSKRAYDRTVASVIVKAIAFLTVTTGFISAVVGLVTGWSQFYAAARSFISSYGL